MTNIQRLLIVALRDYAANSSVDETGGEATGILSAIINTIDTIEEGNLEGYRECRTQAEREALVVKFILSHDVQNSYRVWVPLDPAGVKTDPNWVDACPGLRGYR